MSDPEERRDQILNFVDDALAYHHGRFQGENDNDPARYSIAAYSVVANFRNLAVRKDVQHFGQIIAALHYDTRQNPNNEGAAMEASALDLIQLAWQRVLDGKVLPQHDTLWERWLKAFADHKESEALRLQAVAEHDQKVASMQEELRSTQDLDNAPPTILRSDLGMFTDLLREKNGNG